MGNEMERKTTRVGDYRRADLTDADRAREQKLPALYVFTGPDVTDDVTDWPYQLVVAVTFGSEVRAINYYTGQVVARAGGGGYDRLGSVLAQCATWAYGLPAFDGAQGVGAVVRHCAAHGVTLASLSELCGAARYAWQVSR